jgi:hydroxypyruvate isomerase
MDLTPYSNHWGKVQDVAARSTDCGIILWASSEGGNHKPLPTQAVEKGYMFDHMSWGVEVCRRVGSPNVKRLDDIYHAQIMEGDVIRTIQTYKEYIGHYHTGGNPGRHEIDETQELYYPAIMRAIVDSGFTGYVAHEFVPKRDPLTSLAQGIAICDV